MKFARPLPYFYAKQRPEGQKIFLETAPPRLSKGLDDPPPLILRSGSGTELDVARSGAASLLGSDRLFTSHSIGGPGFSETFGVLKFPPPPQKKNYI